MKEIEISTTYKVYDSTKELNEHDRELIQAAQHAATLAYAPYSNFMVGAVIELDNGSVVSGSNQENASFPVGMCAERVALANLSSQHKNAVVKTIAIYCNNSPEQHPVAPCGMCRQALLEQETRQQKPIRLLLKGNNAEVIEIKSVNDILPLGFSGSDLK